MFELCGEHLYSVVVVICVVFSFQALVLWQICDFGDTVAHSVHISSLQVSQKGVYRTVGIGNTVGL